MLWWVDAVSRRRGYETASCRSNRHISRRFSLRGTASCHARLSLPRVKTAQRALSSNSEFSNGSGAARSVASEGPSCGISGSCPGGWASRLSRPTCSCFRPCWVPLRWGLSMHRQCSMRSAIRFASRARIAPTAIRAVESTTRCRIAVRSPAACLRRQRPRIALRIRFPTRSRHPRSGCGRLSMRSSMWLRWSVAPEVHVLLL